MWPTTYTTSDAGTPPSIHIASCNSTEEMAEYLVLQCPGFVEDMNDPKMPVELPGEDWSAPSNQE